MNILTSHVGLILLLICGYANSQCASGTVLIDTICVPCPQYCQTCNANGTCTACSTGTLISGKCLVCSLNCQTRIACSSVPTDCTSCATHLSLGSTSPKKCVTPAACPIQNCVTCVDKVPSSPADGKTCTLCSDNYFAYNGACNTCPYACSKCSIDIDTYFTNNVVNFLDDQLANAYPGSTARYYSAYTFYQKQNMMQVYALHQIVTTANAAKATDFNNLLKTDLIFTGVDTIVPKKLTNAQKAAYLNLITAGAYTETTAQAKLLNYIQETTTLLTCTQCFPGSYSNLGQCLKCSEGCTECTGPSACTTCQSGYALNGNACQRCTAPCLTCSGTKTTCTSCVRPYFLGSSNNCQLCQGSNCLTCTADGTACATCARPFSELPNSGNCYRCSQQTCAKCNPTNTQQCLSCMPGFALNSTKKCVACQSRCTSCVVLSASNTECRACQTGYALINGGCSQCGVSCQVCSQFDTTVCHKCGPKMFINTNNACQRCPQGCQSCQNNNGLCNRLSAGSAIINGRIGRCGMRGCQVCDTTNPNLCAKCLDGYYVGTGASAGFCLTCSKYCITCTSGSVCTACQQNTVLTVSNACQQCKGRCLTCSPTNTTQCTSCRRGFILDTTTKLCTGECPTGCVECAGASKVCKRCEKGYALKSDGKCVRCLSSCSGSCNSNDLTQCISCDNGFFMKNGKCVRCGTGCLTCIDSQCTSCIDGYTLTQSGNSFVCQLNCNFPCQTCTQTSCLTCATGYTLIDGTCRFSPASCNTGCSTCPAGSYSNSGTCTRCSARGCSSCPTDTCNLCFDGYYLNSASCSPCPTGCRTCSDATTCLTCSYGYIREVLSTGDDVSSAVVAPACAACNDNCKSCSINSDKCQSCKDQFRLKNRKCFGRNNVGFKFKLDTDYAQFISQSKTQQIIAALAKILSKKQSQVQVTSVQSGSTIVQGSISADSNTNSQNLANQLYDALQANNNALGFPLLSSQVNSYYDDTQSYSPASRSYIGAIIGCAIAVGVIIIIVAIVFCCVRRKKKLEKKQLQKEEALHHQYFQKQKMAYNYEIPVYETSNQRIDIYPYA